MVDETEVERLEGEIADVCGVLNAQTGRLVRLIGRVLETEAWQGWGVRSPEQWVAWKCGVSLRRARSLVALARRLPDLPATRAGLEAGELSEDGVTLICRKAPVAVDAQVAELARSTTVPQLGRILNKYSFEEPTAELEPAELPAEGRRVSFGYTERGSWRLAAELPPDEGAVLERAFTAVRDELFRAGEAGSGPGAAAADVSWADAFVAMAERSLAATAQDHPHRDRHLVLLHVRGDGGGQLHLGPGLQQGLRRYLSCDTRVRAVVEAEGKAVSVGRAFRTVPDRTRIVVEDRDGGCRVPGCSRRRWLHVHHVTHWEDGGTSDTSNLLCLCQHHHRLHHRGGLGIAGDADDPDGIRFTDGAGRTIDPCGRPTPPGSDHPPPGHWVPPTGAALDPWAIYFDDPLAVPA